MSATEFTADLRDIRFVLYEELDIESALGRFEKFSDVDRALCDSMLDEAYKISREVLAPNNKVGDRQGCRFDGQGGVTTPDGFKEMWRVLADGGWLALEADPAYGGMGMPFLVSAGVGELMMSSCIAFALYTGLSRSAANLLAVFADDKLRPLVCERIYSGQWGGTMCLTEPGAGSSVGDCRTKATPTPEGDFLLEGEKIFISSGEHDLTENIIHLVLARTPDSPKGTKGLSLFVVPKFRFDSHGTLTERNGVYAAGIEEKMGIHGSATCSMSFGASGPCHGYLLGKEGQGMPIMFYMMNEARLEVGFQGFTGAAAAYENSKAYAAERIQGTSIERFGDPDAPAVTIDQHPDVRRMLMWQRVHVESMRSLLYKMVLNIDVARNTTDVEEKEYLEGQIALLTPIIKSYCSDKGFESAVMGMQVFGGYGYTGEYPVEQHVRDTKIASIYEGTNGIQAMDLLGRKMRQDSGTLFMAWLGTFNDELDKCRDMPELQGVIAAFEKARDSLSGSAMHLAGLGMGGNIAGAMSHASPFLDQFGCVLLGYHSLVQARIALNQLAAAESQEQTFYRGKLLNVRFYAHQVLPRSIAVGKSIRSGDESCLDEALFG